MSCKCHNATFCPDEICIGFEDDLPIYVRRDSIQGRRAIAIEAKARQLAADKMGLVKDPTGSSLPHELWVQSIPEARKALTCRERGDKAERIAWPS